MKDDGKYQNWQSVFQDSLPRRFLHSSGCKVLVGLREGDEPFGDESEEDVGRTHEPDRVELGQVRPADREVCKMEEK